MMVNGKDNKVMSEELPDSIEVFGLNLNKESDYENYITTTYLYKIDMGDICIRINPYSYNLPGHWVGTIGIVDINHNTNLFIRVYGSSPQDVVEQLEKEFIEKKIGELYLENWVRNKVGDDILGYINKILK